MKERIYTIPVNDILADNCGCPICRLYNMLEENALEYITGAAMMEPDTRIKTNQMGFCTEHFEKMMLRRKSLPVALIMESHIMYIQSDIIPKNNPSEYKKNKETKIDKLMDSCYICEKIEVSMNSMIKSITMMWQQDEELKNKLIEQEYICLKHFNILMKNANKYLKKDELKSFSDVIYSLTKKYLDKLSTNITAYCKMYDYRNSDSQEMGDKVLNSPKDIIKFLS